MISDTISKNKGHEKRPLSGTPDFLNKARLCKGVVCVSSNADGLFRVPEMWSKGKDVCDICAESEPVKAVSAPVRFFSAQKSAQPRPQRPPKPPKPQPAPKPPPPPKPEKIDVRAMVAAEVARVLPGLVRAELRKVFANV